MKTWIQTTPDFDHEVVDVFICIDTDDEVITSWVRGYDDVDWEQAQRFAEELATVLNCEYIGEVA